MLKSDWDLGLGLLNRGGGCARAKDCTKSDREFLADVFVVCRAGSLRSLRM
jgi:hypothetical protein